MARNRVTPARLGWLRRFLVLWNADLWGPDWLFDWIADGDPKMWLYVSVVRSLDREPEAWTINPYGVTNSNDGIGVYVVEGADCVAVAVDGDGQHYPTSYFRRLLFDAVSAHRQVVAAMDARETAARLA